MRALPWILLILLLIGMAVVYIAGQREQLIYDRDGIRLDAYDHPPYLSRLTIHQGDIAKFAFIVNGKTVSANEAAESLGKFQEAVGHAKLPSKQLSSSDWVISTSPSGDVDWLSFRPYPSMTVSYDGKTFHPTDTIQNVVTAVGGSVSDIRVERHNQIIEAIREARLSR